MTGVDPAALHGRITDVAGLAVGHFTRGPARATGCTVVLCPQGAVCGVDVRGGAPGTRETDLLRPEQPGRAACTRCCSPAAARSASTPPAA